MTPGYPEEELPKIAIDVGTLSLSEFTLAHKRSLLATVTQAAAEVMGQPCVFACLQAAQSWMSDGLWHQTIASSSDPEANKINTTPATTTSESIAIASVGVAEVTYGSGVINPLNEMICMNVKPPQPWYLVGLELASDCDPVLEQQEKQRIEYATSLADECAARYASHNSELSALEAQLLAQLSTEEIESEAEVADNCTEIMDGIAAPTSSARGLWHFTVGLVGKPSAGKSTFYNAVTRAALDRDGRRIADVAPHPFTTIEPNIGPGWFAMTSPSSSHPPLDDPAMYDALHGRDSKGRRLLPVIIKDVAGLVPGAYQGRGKGNRFLADLCDADVLVHVVDASGRSDKDGNVLLAGEKGSTPWEDAQWINEELHRWIYGNVKSKWPSVVRRGKDRTTRPRVLALFSGYKAPRACTERAALRAGLDIDQAQLWGPLDLHVLVANYLKLRFPTCLALNKCDELVDNEGRLSEDSVVLATCVKKAREKGEIALPMSARAEAWRLLKLANNPALLPPVGSISYLENESVLKRIGQLLAHGEISSESKDGEQTTGVLDVISAAVALKAPVFCYPVSDLDTLAPIGITSGSGNVSRLRDCLLLKPGSTVGDVYEALKKGAVPHASLSGDFVRAEGKGLDVNSRKRQVGRDAVVDASCCVLRIQTNRKALWQHQYIPANEK